MMAVGKDFYGVFPANNTPDPANFPTVFPSYQRNIDKNAQTLLGSDGVTVVNASIDPFFVKITEPLTGARIRSVAMTPDSRVSARAFHQRGGPRRPLCHAPFCRILYPQGRE